MSKTHSARFAFSEEEEQALVCACIVYLRQGTPLTIGAFIDIASFFAQKDDKHLFSRHFCYSFLERHASEICLKSGKLTSPTRCSKVMLQKTKEFITRFEKKMAKYGLSKKKHRCFWWECHWWRGLPTQGHRRMRKEWWWKRKRYDISDESAWLYNTFFYGRW